MDAHAPSRSNFIHFHAVCGGENGPNSRFTPRRLEVALGVGAPSSGKFWIRRCIHHIFRRKLLIMGTCMYIKSILNNKKVVHFKFQ